MKARYQVTVKHPVQHTYQVWALSAFHAVSLARQAFTYEELSDPLLDIEVVEVVEAVEVAPILSFSWDFEDVGDQVVTTISLMLNGVYLANAFITELNDIRIDDGMIKARAAAKRYAKINGYTFISEEPDSHGYRRALMKCYNRNR